MYRKMWNEEMEALRRKIEGNLQETLTFGARVVLVPLQSIPRTEMGKAVRVVREF